jgi:hypothetical protein
MQHMGLTNGISTPSASRKKAYEELYEADPSASNVKALHTLFLTPG